MTKSSEFDLEAALRDPQAFFAEPKDIAAHPQLSRQSKLALLRQWEQHARSLSVAEGEGMVGGEGNMLGRVEQAISSVEMQTYAPADNFRRGPHRRAGYGMRGSDRRSGSQLGRRSDT